MMVGPFYLHFEPHEWQRATIIWARLGALAFCIAFWTGVGVLVAQADTQTNAKISAFIERAQMDEKCGLDGRIATTRADEYWPCSTYAPYRLVREYSRNLVYVVLKDGGAVLVFESARGMGQTGRFLADGPWSDDLASAIGLRSSRFEEAARAIQDARTPPAPATPAQPAPPAE